MPIEDHQRTFQLAIDTYRRGEHYESHELWEQLWQTECDDQRRRFLQALIQIASAVHKAVNDVGPRGAVRLLDAATDKLQGLPDLYLSLDVAALRTAVMHCRTEVSRQVAAGACKLTEEHIPLLIQQGPIGPWIQLAPNPTVADAARGAWFDRGIAAYQAGDYFEAHELWEELWRDAPRDFDRQFIQGLIQVAAAMHKVVTQQKPAPAARLLDRALLKLQDAPDDYRGLQTRRLIAECRRAKIALARVAQNRARQPEVHAGHDARDQRPETPQFDTALVPTVSR